MNNQHPSETFAAQLSVLGDWYNLVTLFDDFLTITISALNNSLDQHNDCVCLILRKYTRNYPGLNFKRVFGTLLQEVTERADSRHGNDVLGEFYEDYLFSGACTPLQTPWTLCDCGGRDMAPAIVRDQAAGKPCAVLDYWCGSGRRLLSVARHAKCHAGFYGIDADVMCVKMAVINLYLNKVSKAEVLGAYVDRGATFICCYGFSSVRPRITSMPPEASELWQHVQSETVRREILMAA